MCVYALFTHNGMVTRPNKVYTLLIRFLYEGAPLTGGRETSREFVDGVLRCLLEMARCMQVFMHLCVCARACSTYVYIYIYIYYMPRSM